MPIRKEYDKEKDFLPAKKAIVATLSNEDLTLDTDLQKLSKVMIKPTFRNLEEAFWNDSISTSFTDITAAVIIGDGLRIRCENKEALEIIKEWNRNINVKRQTVEDWIRDTWFDLIVYGTFYWRVDDRTSEYVDVDIQRIDPKSMEVREDPVMGYRKFIQHIGTYSYYRTKKSFYRSAGKEYDSLWYGDRFYKLPGEVSYGNKQITDFNTAEIEIHIPDEPRSMLFSSYFRKPPIANALHYIVYKRWILWYMRKYSQKHWAPFVVLKVGDPKSNTYPQDKHKMQAAIDNGKTFIRQITNFGGVSIPGEMDLQTLETGTAKSSEIYVLYIRELDKQIMYTIFGSMGQREASGSELATAREIQEGWLRFIKGMRRMYELLLTNFWAYCLLPYHDINDLKPHKIEIDYSPLRLESTQELMTSIKLGAEVGLWEDINEMRKAAQPVFGFLNDLSEDKNKKVELLAPIGKESEGSPKGRLMEYNKQKQAMSS